MDIGILKTDLSSGLTAELLQAMRDQKALTAGRTVADADASLVNTSSLMPQSLSPGGGNMMDNLFVHAASEESRYVSALKTSLAVDMQMQLSQSAALLERFGGINPSGTYFGSNGVSDREVKEALKREGDKEIIEGAKKDFDKTAEKAEEKADEAVAAAGKDEGGSTGAVGEGDAAAETSDKASAGAGASDNASGAAATDADGKKEPSARAATDAGADEPKSSTAIIAAEAEAAAAKKQAKGIETAAENAPRNAPLAAQAQAYATRQNALSGTSITMNRVNTVA